MLPGNSRESRLHNILGWIGVALLAGLILFAIFNPYLPGLFGAPDLPSALGAAWSTGPISKQISINQTFALALGWIVLFLLIGVLAYVALLIAVPKMRRSFNGPRKSSSVKQKAIHALVYFFVWVLSSLFFVFFSPCLMQAYTEFAWLDISKVDPVADSTLAVLFSYMICFPVLDFGVYGNRKMTANALVFLFAGLLTDIVVQATLVSVMAGLLSPSIPHHVFAYAGIGAALLGVKLAINYIFSYPLVYGAAENGVAEVGANS